MSFSTSCDHETLKSMPKTPSTLRKPQTDLKDALLHAKPIEGRSTGVFFKQNFASFLDGQLDADKLIQTLNCPRLNRQPTPIAPFDSQQLIKQQSEQRRCFLRSKAHKIKDLIDKRVQFKKPENERMRQENAQNMVLVQAIIDIANNKQQQQRAQGKLIPKSRSLKEFKISYDNVRPIIQQQKQIIQNTPDKPYLRMALECNSQLYMEELESQIKFKENELNRQVRLHIQQKSTDFKLYHKAAKTDRRNPDGILTYADVQLYDYLYNQPKSIQITKNPKYIQNVIENNNELKIKRQWKARKTMRYNVIQPEIDKESNDSSLCSAGEIKLDNYYTESRELSKKCYTQLSRRIKQLMQLEELNQKAIHTTHLKLK